MLRRNGVILTLIAVALAAMIGAGCAKQGEASRDDGITDTTRIGGTTDQTGATSGTTSWVQERQILEARLNSTIQQLNTRIEQLSGQAANATGEIKENLDDQIENLKDNREELTDDLRDLGQASQDNWEDVREEINESLNNVDSIIGIDPTAPGYIRSTTRDRDTTMQTTDR